MAPAVWPGMRRQVAPPRSLGGSSTTIPVSGSTASGSMLAGSKWNHTSIDLPALRRSGNSMRTAHPCFPRRHSRSTPSLHSPSTLARTISTSRFSNRAYPFFGAASRGDSRSAGCGPNRREWDTRPRYRTYVRTTPAQTSSVVSEAFPATTRGGGARHCAEFPGGSPVRAVVVDPVHREAGASAAHAPAGARTGPLARSAAPIPAPAGVPVC